MHAIFWVDDHDGHTLTVKNIRVSYVALCSQSLEDATETHESSKSCAVKRRTTIKSRHEVGVEDDNQCTGVFLNIENDSLFARQELG
jgi:hypothetical protein